MPPFDDFLAALQGEIKELVDRSWKDFALAATQDANDFVTASRNDLRRWTALLADGSLTLLDFEFLLAAKKDLAQMIALKQAGLAQVQLDRFINGVVGAIIGAAEKTLL